jgi:hypothetical protein
VVDVRALHTTDGTVIDLADIDCFTSWRVPSPMEEHQHPLILSNDPFFRLRGNMHKEWLEKYPQRVLAVDFFIPTSGYSNMTPTGNMYTDHSLRPQQLDFLMSFFENWEVLNCTLVISFCDESPELTSVLETIYSLMAIYEIPHKNIKFAGHNFAGQEVINNFAKENGEVPLTYIVAWWMIGHVDTVYLENVVERSFKINSNGQHSEAYNMLPVEITPKSNTFIFLNRRETDNRMSLLYLLWKKGVKHVDSIISAFPPLKLFGLSSDRPGAGSSETGIRTHYTSVFFQSVLKELIPWVVDEHTDVDTHNFKEEMKLGKSLPGDHAFIGDKESRFVPQSNDAYVWLTCESTSDLKEKNIFFTEKVLKPMMYGQALVVFAQPGFIKAFKALGFHTLCEEYGIDESYDDEHDDAKRIDMIADEIIKVGAVPLLKMHEIALTLEDKIRENKLRMWLMLSNISKKTSFTTQQSDAVNIRIHTDLPAQSTDEALSMYKDFWDMNIVSYK